MCTKLKYRFETMELDDSIVAVPIEEGAQKFRGVVKLNESGMEIFTLLEQEESEKEIITELSQRHGNDPDIPGYVHEFIELLFKEGILE